MRRSNLHVRPILDDAHLEASGSHAENESLHDIVAAKAVKLECFRSSDGFKNAHYGLYACLLSHNFLELVSSSFVEGYW